MNENVVFMETNIESENWEIKTDGYFKKSVTKQLITDDISSENAEKIFQNGVEILSECPNPQNSTPEKKTGIVIGKVQSGKTSNFISTIALAFDNGYQISVVLGGNKNILLGQNAERIKQSFNVETEKLAVLTTKDNKSLLDPNTIKDFLNNGRRIVIVALKHVTHIDKISEIFDGSALGNIPTIIVDDEGDQATLNTQAYKKRISTTYSSVLKLKQSIQKHCFISVTATPQANILIQTFDSLSPDFGVLVYPGEQYCGLNDFHSEDNQDVYVKEIPVKESNVIDGIGIPESVKKALATFFMGGAIRRFRGDNRNHSMLIHPSEKKYDHKIVVDKLENLLSNWKSISNLKVNGQSDISYMVLEKNLKEAYDQFYSDGVNLPGFKNLEPFVLDIICKCSPIHICNSDEDASENAKLYLTNIFVGGNMVERGITIKGLAVTYITRRAKGISNVDNTEQRARWFGYKRDFLDVCRVFTSKDIKADFLKILEHDEDLWATIERAQMKGIRFKEIPRLFVLSSKKLRLTRSNVAKTNRFSFSEWSRQNKFLFDEQKGRENINILEVLKNDFSSEIEDFDFIGVNKHKKLSNISFPQVNSQYLQRLSFPNSSNIDTDFLKNIEELIFKYHLDPSIDIVWMRYESRQTRKISQNGAIEQLFTGNTPNLASNSFYCGDRKIVNNNVDRMQLQIHYVRPSNMEHVNYYSPILALYLPPHFLEEISKTVGVKKE